MKISLVPKPTLYDFGPPSLSIAGNYAAAAALFILEFRGARARVGRAPGGMNRRDNTRFVFLIPDNSEFQRGRRG